MQPKQPLHKKENLGNPLALSPKIKKRPKFIKDHKFNIYHIKQFHKTHFPPDPNPPSRFSHSNLLYN